MELVLILMSTRGHQVELNNFLFKTCIYNNPKFCLKKDGLYFSGITWRAVPDDPGLQENMFMSNGTYIVP